jgi:hypothetical protein
MACALGWFHGVAAAQGVINGDIKGTVYTVDSDGGRSVVPGALVKLIGPSSSRQTLTDDRGRYSFAPLATNTYRIDATAPGLSGSNMATFVSGIPLDVPVELKVEAVKESVTATAGAEPPVSTYLSEQSIINRSTVVNAPNKQDQIDALLPLIPGVVRGPDGLINMKGARSSQNGSLVNSANVTDPVTGNAAMNLPIDVVESVKVIANPYDPEYGRLTGAVSSVETVTGNFNSFHVTAQNLLVRPRGLRWHRVGNAACHCNRPPRQE